MKRIKSISLSRVLIPCLLPIKRAIREEMAACHDGSLVILNPRMWLVDNADASVWRETLEQMHADSR